METTLMGYIGFLLWANSSRFGFSGLGSLGGMRMVCRIFNRHAFQA